MTSRALCVGINQYQRADLQLKGCVNDARRWSALLCERLGVAPADVTQLTDARATKQAVMTALRALVTGARPRDRLFFTCSCLGTYGADWNDDESQYDEALCPYDCDVELIYDDELGGLFRGLPRGAYLTVILDTCHSGSQTRGFDLEFSVPDRRRPRYCDPRLLGRRSTPDVRRMARPHTYGTRADFAASVLVLHASRPDQYAYDARFGRRYHGAMTHHAASLIESAKGKLTFAQLQRSLVTALQTDSFDQEPQLDGPIRVARRDIFS